MFKKIVVLLVSSFSFLAPFVFAQEEKITITTYYPSPYGSYNELRANKIAVSPTRAMPTTDGVLNWGDYRGQLNTVNGASIILGGNGNPYIKFYNNMDADSDVATISLSGSGFRTTGNFIVGGIAYMRGDSVTNGCLMLTYGTNSGTTHCPSGTTLNTTLSGATPTGEGGIMYCCR